MLSPRHTICARAFTVANQIAFAPLRLCERLASSFRRRFSLRRKDAKDAKVGAPGFGLADAREFAAFIFGDGFQWRLCLATSAWTSSLYATETASILRSVFPLFLIITWRACRMP